MSITHSFYLPKYTGMATLKQKSPFVKKSLDYYLLSDKIANFTLNKQLRQEDLWNCLMTL